MKLCIVCILFACSMSFAVKPTHFWQAQSLSVPAMLSKVTRPADYRNPKSLTNLGSNRRMSDFGIQQRHHKTPNNQQKQLDLVGSFTACPGPSATQVNCSGCRVLVHPSNFIPSGRLMFTPGVQHLTKTFLCMIHESLS